MTKNRVFKKLLVIIFIFFLFSGRFSRVESQVISVQDKPSFVPGQVIVRYKPNQNPQDLSAQVELRQQRSKTVSGHVQNLNENINLRANGQNLPEEKLNQIRSLGEQVGVIKEEKVFEGNIAPSSNLQNFYLYQTDGVTPVEELVNKYKSLPEVQYAEPNGIRYANEVIPDDTLFPNMWGLEKIQVKKAWDITKGSDSVIVAVIDTGIDLLHEDFAGRQLISGYNFVSCEELKRYCSGTLKECCITLGARGNNPQEKAGGGHGTHVAGTIGAVTNNGKGVSGINWNVKIMPLRVLGKSGGIDSDITEAIKYAADNDAKVINMSLGGIDTCYSDSIYQAAIDYAYGKGVTVVVAAGNDNNNTLVYSPAGCSNIITVAAVGPNDERSYFSNYGDSVALSAPGGDAKVLVAGNTGCFNKNCILSTIWKETESSLKYDTMQGTSQASPHVAGVAALILSVNPNLTPDQVKNILKNNVDSVTTEADKPIGTGRLNAYKAVLAARATVSTPTPTATKTPTLTSTPRPTNTPLPTATPTLGLCQCQAGLPAKNKGNALCDEVIDNRDLYRWRDEKKGILQTKTADFNCDGKVDIYDLMLWRENHN